jgi:hypothetical protein
MGRESKVEYSDGRERALVKAHLDSLNLQLSGGKKLVLPLAQVKAATVEGDALKIAAGAVKFSLRLGGREAELWAKKILNPPSLADKLGFKVDKAVTLVGALPAEVVAAAKGTRVTAVAKLPKTLAGDIAAAALSPGKEDAQIAAAARALTGSAALWLVYAKGQAVNGDDVIALARKAGLKDTKVARVSESHAALRFIKAKP